MSKQFVSRFSSALALFGWMMLALTLARAMSAAQQVDAGAGAVATLRVSTNIIQIPVLVLTKNKESLQSRIAPDRFEIRLDGQWVRPKYVRLEGQDPISLAILLDSRQTDLLAKMTQGLTSLASSSLTSKDHISVFLMGCSSIRMVADLPADADLLRSALSDALRAQNASSSAREKVNCKESSHLWDTLAYVTRSMESSSGRRVILAITDGEDKGSKISPPDLIALAQSDGVTIFGLDPTGYPKKPLFDKDQKLLSVSEWSGGLRLDLNGRNLDKEFKSFIEILRERYIVEFPRPLETTAGKVDFAARISGFPPDAYFIRVAGKSVPLPNPVVDGDATVRTAMRVAPDDTAHLPSLEVGQPPNAETGERPAGAGPDAAIVATQSAAHAEDANGPPEPVAQAITHPDSGPRPATDEAQSSVTIKVTSRLTLVDVTVTDSKGRPVHGLSQADFTVKEDGKPQPIKNFEEYGTGKPATDPTPPLPPNVYSDQLTPQPTTQAVNILLLDQVTFGLAPHPEAVKAAKEASSQYVKTMPEGTQVAVLEIDGDGLHMVQGFTADRDLLLAALNSVTYQAVPEARWNPPDVPGEEPNMQLLYNAFNFQSAQALNALNQMALFVSSIPGRKNLLWFTLGVPWLTDYQLFNRGNTPPGLTDFTPQLQQVYGRLTAARIAVYPINPLGVLYEGNLNGTNGSLEDMAKATGGKPHFDNDMTGALREDTAIGADYYALSYVPPLSKYDGKHHTIEVKVDRPGLQLEYRRGYTSLDLAGPLRMPEKNSSKNAQPADPFHTAMDYGEPAATQLVFAVRAMPSTESRELADAPMIGSLNPELKGKPLVRYSFDFDLPRDKITLVEQPDGTRKGSFELVIAAYDVQGRRLNSLDEKRSFILKPEMMAGFLQKPFVVPVLLDLPKGKLLVRAGVRDLPSDKIGAFEIPLSVTGR